MSKKQHPKNCLCPDCIKAAMDKVRAEQKPKPGIPTADLSLSIDSTSLYKYMRAMMEPIQWPPATLTISTSAPQERGPKPPALADVVAEQVAELTSDFEGQSKPELPKPPITDTYADAYSSAIRNCDHPSEMIQDTLYGREWQCRQCGKFFDRTTLPRRGFFGI